MPAYTNHGGGELFLRFNIDCDPGPEVCGEMIPEDGDPGDVLCEGSGKADEMEQRLKEKKQR